MQSYLFLRKRRWRNFNRYRKQRLSLRRILFFLIIAEFLILTFTYHRPVTLTRQVYSVWERVFYQEEISSGIRVRWKDGEIELYKSEKILR